MFVIHHVGGRSGSRGFPVIKGLERDIVSVLYEADEDAVGQIEAVNSGLESKTIVLPWALGAKEGPASLRLTYDPNQSSLFEPITASDLFYTSNPLPQYEYPLSSTMKVVEERSVRLRRLDQIVEVDGIPAPDFLSIDVQGAELDVLIGCGGLLKNVVGVLVEVEFEPLYVEQPLFSEVHEFMRANGFILMHVDGFGFDYGPPPVGARAHASWTAGDALYLKPPGDPNNDKAALAALAFGYSGRALASFSNVDGDELWQSALMEFAEISRREKSHGLPHFHEVFSIDESFARFDVQGSHLLPGRRRATSLLITLLRRPIMAPVYRLAIFFNRHKLVRFVRTHKRQRVLHRLQMPYRQWAEKWGFQNYIGALNGRLQKIA